MKLCQYMVLGSRDTSTPEVEVEKHSETEDVVGLCDTALKPGLFVEGSFDDKCTIST